MLNGLDLFSGIGGLTLALSPWVRPLAYCENDRYATAVLLSRMAKGELPTAPIWDDIRTLKRPKIPPIDIIYGGFPCQDISSAGPRGGLGGERSKLFFEVTRLCRDLRPQFVFLENVADVTVRGLERICLEFTKMGYDSRWTIVSAGNVGAPHKRERWWFLAHTPGEPRREGLKESNIRQWPTNIDGHSWWSSEPGVARVVHGLPARVDRVRGLGNAVVPAQAREAFMRLSGLTHLSTEAE